MGGYRVGSGRSKSGYYQGMYCGSTYELCWVIYNLDHGIPFSRFEKMLELNGVRYLPDFLLDDGRTIIEIKGYEPQESVDRKTRVAESHGYSVVVLRKDQLAKEFEYVTRTHSKNYRSLYDGYKPSFNYTCHQCSSSFGRDKETTGVKFCSRKCAGVARKLEKIENFTATLDHQYLRKIGKELALNIFNSEGSYASIAKTFNVTKNNVWAIKTKRNYKWIH